MFFGFSERGGISVRLVEEIWMDSRPRPSCTYGLMPSMEQGPILRDSLGVHPHSYHSSREECERLVVL